MNFVFRGLGIFVEIRKIIKFFGDISIKGKSDFFRTT